MYYEVYLDMLFLVNFLMDYVVLLITGKILKEYISYHRIVLASFLGSVLTCVSILCPLPYPVKVGVSFVLLPGCMLLVGFYAKKKYFQDPPGKRIQRLVKGMISLYIGGWIVGGVFAYFHQYVQVGSLFFLIAVVSFYVVSGILWFLEMTVHFGGCRCKVEIYQDGNLYRANALIDTGNRLRDPVTGKGVHVISVKMAEKMYGKECRMWLKGENPMPEGFYNISCHTIGSSEEKMPVVVMDKMKVCGKKEQWIDRPVVAISTVSSFGDEFDVILNLDR